MENKYTEDIFIIDCWTDTVSKENDLIGLIKILKEFNIPILLTGHYEVKPEIQKMVDFYLYDRNNDLLMEHEFESHGVASGRWTSIGNWKVENKMEFHHDYAIWCAMRNSFNFAKSLGKKYIHFFEYDNLPDPIQYRQAFLEYSRKHDAILYEYNEGSSKDKHFAEYCATYIFSIKTDVAIQVIDKVKSKREYFTNRPKGWQLERVFLQHLKEVTNNITISKYIANDNELNTQAVWNRDGMNRNGARFQLYLGVDKNQNLYVHFISGFHEKPAEKDYLIEVNYGSHKKFYNIKKGEYSLEKLGKYRKGDRVKIYHQGNEVFNEYLKDNFEEFRRKNTVTFMNESSDRTINIHNIDGPFIEIKESNDSLYHIQFIDRNDDKVKYELNLKSNHWAKCSIKYYVDWKIIIKGVDNDFYTEHIMETQGKRILISFESKSVGDTLAFMPYVEKFKSDRNAQVICSTFHNYLFKDQYPDIEFVEPGSNVTNINALYRLGMFYKGENENRKIDLTCHPTDPKPLPLLQVASDILGLDYEERKPRLKKTGKKKYKRVCIAIHSTAQAKYWNNPTGWQEVVDVLLKKGYEVRLISAEENGFMGNYQPKGVTKQPKGTLVDLIKVLQESEFFIGISSGLSWLSWACDIPTVIVSGFTDVDLEPLEGGVIRIINKDVCHGCWSKHDFNPGDWNWCPEHKGTDRQFECSKNITGADVIKQIETLLF
jgi:autotransporter strand-loop-strand O-heptosyltransferase